MGNMETLGKNLPNPDPKALLKCGGLCSTFLQTHAPSFSKESPVTFSHLKGEAR